MELTEIEAERAQTKDVVGGGVEVVVTAALDPPLPALPC